MSKRTKDTASDDEFDDEFDEGGEDEEEEEADEKGSGHTERRRRRLIRNSMLVKESDRHGPTRHNHPWMNDPNDILDIDIENNMSMGLMSLGDIGFDSEKAGGDGGKGRRRRSRGPFRFSLTRRPPSDDKGDQNSSAQPLVSKRHKQSNMSSINESSLPDVPDDPPLRPGARFMESSSNFEDIHLGTEQRGGETALEKIEDPMAHIPFHKAMNRNTTVVVKTQNLDYNRPTGAKNTKPKSFWATICPCCPCC